VKHDLIRDTDRCSALRGGKRGRAEDIAHDLIPVWPRDTRFGNRCRELLYQASVKGRYSPHYVIRDVELE
jgi:hypothetical protein